MMLGINGTTDPIYVPEEVIVNMMSWLSEETLLSARLVDSVWARLASDNSLWKPFLEVRPTILFPKDHTHTLFQHHILNNPGIKIRHVQSHLGRCYAAWGKTIAVWKRTHTYPQIQYESTYTETDHTGSINTFFFHKKSYVPFMVTGSADTTLKVWKMRLGTHHFELLETLRGHETPIVKVIGTTHTIFSGSTDGKVCVWNDNFSTSTPSYSLDKTLETQQRSITALETDGTTSYFQLFSGGIDGTIKIWKKKLRELKCTQVLSDHRGDITSLRYDTSSRLLFSTSTDRTIRIWQSVNQQYLCMCTITDAHADKVTDCLPFNKGTQLLSSSTDGSIKLWKKGEDHSWALEAAVSMGNRGGCLTLASGSPYQTLPQVYAVACGIISQFNLNHSQAPQSFECTYFPVTLIPSDSKETVPASNLRL